MCGGGKSATSTQSQSGSVSGAPQAIAMGDQSWKAATAAAGQPFQTYGGEFVAPINQQQTQGISGINDAAGTYAPYGSAAVGSLAPYFGAATQAAGQGLSATGAGLGLTANYAQLDPNAVNRWMSPYLQNVVQATENQQQQQNQIQQSQLQGNAIQQGAFGGDRGGVAAANLAYQQNLANQPVIANLYQQGYGQALGQANTQQQAGLSAGAQFGNLGSQLFQGANQFANLGTGLSGAYSGLGTTAQNNQLTAANAQVGAGTLQQQTQQAQNQALYNQFLQQQAYPFQTSQFLTNAAQALSPIYGTQTQTYGTATQPSSFFQRGGAVDLEMDDNGVYRPRKAGGGGLSDEGLAALIAAHGQMYAPRVPGAEQGPYGVGLSAGHAAQAPTVQLQSMLGGQHRDTGVGHSIDTLNRTADFGKNLAGLYSLGKEAAVGTPASTASGKTTPASSGLFGYGGKWGETAPASPTAQGMSAAPAASTIPNPTGAPTLPDGTPILDENFASGGRVGLAAGGLPYTSGISDPYIPGDISEPNTLSRDLKSALGDAASGGMSGMGGGSHGSGLGSALGSVASIGSSIAKIAPLFFALKDGGRIGKEVGGGLSDAAPPADNYDLFPKMLVAESNNRHFDDKTGLPTTSGKGAVGISQVMPTTAPEAAKLAGVEWNPELFNRGRTGDPVKDKEAEDYNRKLGQAYYNEQKRTFGDPVIASAAYNAGPAAVREAQDRAAKMGGSYLDYLPSETRNYVAKVGHAASSPQPAPATTAMNSPLPGTNTPPAPQGSWWDRESGGLSGTERGIISLLSGLGGMASSPSRFFGGALLSGLGAGANTYGQLAQKGKGLDISQQQANTAVGQLGIAQMQKNIELYNQLRVLAGGYARTGQPVPQWITDQLNTIGRNLYSGSSPMPGGGSAPSGGLSGAPTPVNGPGTGISTPPPQPAVSQQPSGGPLPAPVKAEPLPAPNAQPQLDLSDPAFRKALGPDRDPIALRERARESAAFGDAAGAKENMERADRLEAEYRTTGKATGEGGKTIDVPGFAETQASVGRIGENQKWIDEQSTQAINRAQAREQLDVIKGVLENFESGSLAGMKAQAQALAKSLGINLPDTGTMNAADYQEFMKSALRNVFTDVKDMGGRPLVSEISGFERATAHPELQPEANKVILAQMYARLNQLDKYYGDISTQMSGNKALDRGAYTAQWLKQKDNQLAPLVDQATQGLAVRGATPTDVSKMKENHTYIIEPGQLPGVTERGKYKFVRNPETKKPELKKAD